MVLSQHMALCVLAEPEDVVAGCVLRTMFHS